MYDLVEIPPIDRRKVDYQHHVAVGRIWVIEEER